MTTYRTITLRDMQTEIAGDIAWITKHDAYLDSQKDPRTIRNWLKKARQSLDQWRGEQE